MTSYTDIDFASPNFRHGAYMPDDPSFSGTTSAVIRVDKHGNLLTSNLGAPVTLRSGTQEVGTTAVQLSSSSVKNQEVCVQAAFVNGDFVMIGNSSHQSFRLYPGEAKDVKIDDLNKIYLKSNSGTCDVSYVGS